MVCLSEFCLILCHPAQIRVPEFQVENPEEAEAVRNEK